MHIHITFMTYHLYMLIACQSLSVHFLCLWHIFYLYFSCFYTLHISYSFYNLLFYVFGISPIYTFTVFSLSHILCLFLVICLYLILDLFRIISCIMFFASFLYFHVHFLSCSYIVHVSYTFISHILSYNLSYTVLYFYLHSYTFHIRYFCMLSSDTFHVLYFHMSFTCF